MKESPVTRKRRAVQDYQKITRKVSFSLLPPAEIEFDSDVASTSVDEFQKIPTDSNVTHFLNEDYPKRSLKYDQQAVNRVNSATCDARVTLNALDDANEMLMDIIEEIEAENICVEECLRDAVSLNIIDAECARTVIGDFDANTHTAGDRMNNNTSAASDSGTVDKTNADSLKPTDKLLDLLSTFAVEDLSRCCKYTMGKLCQLTSFEEYETVQKLATKRQLLLESSLSIAIDTDSVSSEFPDDSSIHELSGLSSCGSDNFEDSSGLGSELDFQCGAGLNSTGFEMLPHQNSVASERAIKRSLPLLIDQKVLTPRQVWTILGSKDDGALAETFAQEISAAIRTTQNRYFLPNKSVDDNFTKAYARKSNSLAYPGCNHHRRDIDCYNSKPGERQKRSFTVTSARSNSFSNTFKSSNSSSRQNRTPVRIGRRSSANDTFTCKDYAALILWCKENELPSRTAYILHCNGCDSEDDLLELDVENARYIQDFSWNCKTRLIVAIESLRLERHYHHMKKKLAACSSVLKSIPS